MPLDAFQMPDVPDSDAIGAEIGHTGWANLTGHPAVPIPYGFTNAGLPAGLQLTGRLFDDATILRLAHHYERATEWHRRRPETMS